MDEKTRGLVKPIYLSYPQMINELQALGSKLGQQKEKCSICLDEFSPDEENIIRMYECIGHYFHDVCISNCRQGKNFIKCPNCMGVYGIQTGTMPSGSMTVSRLQGMIPGFDSNTYFKIDYNVSGTQIAGVSYRGANRTAYIPDTPEGKRAISLLTQAFQRGLTFVPGRSVTSGANAVIWAIHHKTDITGTDYSYPDATYLERLFDELKARGVR